jgi:sarcosine oxidase subunit beta
VPNRATDADVVVIGAGVIGSAVAFELSRRGHRTVSVDALPAAGYGSTSASCAIVRFTYSTYPGVAMAWEGLHYWTDWPGYLEAPDERGLAELVQCGTLLLKQPGGHHDKVVPLFDRVGIPYEDWDAEQLRARMPQLDPGVLGPPRPVDDSAFWQEATEPLPGAIWTAQSGYVTDPQLASHNLQRAAEAKGGRFRFGVKVVSVDRDGDRVGGVTLDDGSRVTAPVVVNVAGPHSGRVNELAGLGGTMNIGTRPLRHEVHHVPAPRSVDYERTGCHVSDGDTGVYFRPARGNSILVGSEDPACDERDWVEDPDSFDRSVSEAQWRAQVLRLARRIPDLGVPNEKRGVVDLYDVSDDWIPVYDRTDLDGFYVAIGTSGNQFKNAGVAGHCLAELVEAVEGGHDHDADPLVVTGRYTGVDLDLGAFSRNRTVNPDSSFSVNG